MMAFLSYVAVLLVGICIGVGLAMSYVAIRRDNDEPIMPPRRPRTGRAETFEHVPPSRWATTPPVAHAPPAQEPAAAE